MQWIRRADGVLLVDHGLQRMKEYPQLVLRLMAQMGLTGRLFLLFTHMDAFFDGPISDRDEAIGFVEASVQNFLATVQPRLGDRSTAMLRERLREHTYYAGRLNHSLDPRSEDDAETIEDPRALLAELLRL